MNFEQFTVGTGATARTFTVAEQQAAWEAYIQQDSYLNANRGKYAERGGISLPMVYRADFSIVQDVFSNIASTRNGVQFRVDFLNVGNLLNKDWGVGQRFVSTQPLIARPADAQGRALYRLREIGGQLISKTYEPTNLKPDVFQVQFSLRYNFN
jgi:hypothetical protein